MAGIAETAKLVSSLELKDNFTPNANKAMKSLGKMESTSFRVGQNIGKGMKNAASNLKRIGIVAGVALAGAVAVGVKGGLENLALLENATTSVTGAISQMGLTGKVTADQIAAWANDIEAATDAAFDDKDIVKATGTLIRFGKLAPKNIRPAMQVITDLAVKTGSVESAANMLGKALADPTKAAGKLAKAGVLLTAAEVKQINAFVKAGKVAQAQDVILKSLSKTTAGAAKNSVGPYGDAIAILADVTEDAQKALAVGFLPVLTEVNNILSEEIGKPATLNALKEFGTSMAGALKGLIATARGLPWGAIGDALKLAGTGAKAVLDAFLGMPAWVQTAVLTSWGLNKLTGGALGGIVAELGKGLIKGVLGMTAGVVNLKAGTVVGGGGGVPAAGGAAGAGLLGTAAAVAIPVTIAAIASKAAADIANSDFAKQGVKTDFTAGEGPFGIISSLKMIDQGIKLLRGDIKATPTASPFGVDRGADRGGDALRDSFDRAQVTGTAPAITELKGKIADDLAVQTDAIGSAGRTTSQAATGAGITAANASRTAGATVAAAVAANRPITNVDIRISATTVQQVATVQTRYGSTGGDRTGDTGSHGGNRGELI